MRVSVEDLIREREEASSVSYQNFVLLTSSHPNSLFCFFENKDAPYYHLRIKSNFHGEVHYIRCGNKSLVKKTFGLIKNHEEYNDFKKAFFIDRDFDESIKDNFEEIYETPCYSIENLYCSKSSFKELVKTDFHIGEEEALHNTIVDLYETLQRDFLSASLLFNAWYKLQKQKKRELERKLDVSLDDSLIPSFIEMSLQQITNKYTIDSILEKYPNYLPYNEQELNDVVSELGQSDLRLVLRGKYIFNFMTSFIRKLVDDGADKNKRTVLDKKVKYNMDNSMSLTLLTTYAETPECLESFIQKYN